MPIPILIHTVSGSPHSPEEICAAFLRTEEWSTFQGSGPLPGIRRAAFEVKTPGWTGSVIRVHNTDGSSHAEEITRWDPERGISIHFRNFASPVRHLATHFTEDWHFLRTAGGTEVTRTMTMYPRHWLGALLLRPISRLMKQAFEAHNRKLAEG
ncbi:MAG: SRPBCC family protein [Bacteroidia bacterium]|nr:SRPBCC family protein [Bacteroidia bacterium]